MAFPDDRLPIRAQFAFGADPGGDSATWQWADVSGDIDAQSIAITRGRANESSRVRPTTASLTLNNASGAYTPDHPLSPYWPDVDQGVPARIAVQHGDTRLKLPGVDHARAYTPDTPALSITGDIDIRIEMNPVTWWGATNAELAGKWKLPDQGSWFVVVFNGAPWLLWTEDGSTNFLQAGATAQLPPATQRAALRVTLDVDNGSGGWTVRFFHADSISGPWIQLGDDVTGAGTTSIFDSTAPLEIGDMKDLSINPDRDMAGDVYAFQLRDGIDGALVADVDFTTQTDGATTFTDATGLDWTVDGGAEVTNWHTRIIGQADSWEPEWPYGDLSDGGSGGEARTTVTISGLLRRLDQGAQALQSTLRRRVPTADPAPLAYWPMEDGRDASEAASGLAGGQPLTVTGVNWAADDTLGGSSPLPTLGTSGRLYGAIPGAAADGWHVEMVYLLDELPATEQTMLRLHVSGAGSGVTSVRVRCSTAGIRVQALDEDDGVVAFFLYTNAGALADFAGTWNRFQLYSYDDGTDTYPTIGWRNIADGGYWRASTVYSGGPGRATAVRGAWGSDFQGMPIGHLAAWDIGGTSTSSPGVTVFDGADDGFTGETAGRRMERLASEEGIRLAVVGDPNDTEPMGPQRAATLLELLRECADVDGGILGEQREHIGLRYRTRVTLYNQPPALALDAANNEIANPFRPVKDDQRITNDVTVSRREGSSARVADDASIARRGHYPVEITLNTATDDQLPDLAGWMLHLGTWPDMRYPSVTTELVIAPQLITQWLQADSGDRQAITGLPPQHPSETVELLAEGYTETLTPTRWTARAVCSPAEPWTVGVLVSESETTEDFEDTTYSLTITDGGDAAWARDNAQAHSGSWSLKSGAITDNQTTDAVVGLPPDAQRLSFWYMTSSEESGPGFTGDFLSVHVDGTEVLRAQGETAWTQHELDVRGAAEVTFRYSKDNSAGAGSDAAWIDDLTVSVLDDAGTDQPNRIDTDGSELAAAASSTATALSVATTAGPVWTTSAVELPFDIRIGGEVMTVTAISGATSPQSFTVIRSVNGVVKAHDAGIDVRLAQPMILSL